MAAAVFAYLQGTPLPKSSLLLPSLPNFAFLAAIFTFKQTKHIFLRVPFILCEMLSQ